MEDLGLSLWLQDQIPPTYNSRTCRHKDLQVQELRNLRTYKLKNLIV